MEQPVEQPQGETHAYVARAWYRDTATLFNIFSFLVLIAQEKDFLIVVPERFHAPIASGVVIANMAIRYFSSTRPVALQQGTTREVYSIPPRTSTPPNNP